MIREGLNTAHAGEFLKLGACSLLFETDFRNSWKSYVFGTLGNLVLETRGFPSVLMKNEN